MTTGAILRVQDARFDQDGRAIVFDARRLIWAEPDSYEGGTRIRLEGLDHDVPIVAPYEQVKALMTGAAAFDVWNREHLG